MAQTRSRATEDPAPTPDPRRGGYVLIEAVATFTVVMMILAFALPTVSSGTTPTRLLALASSSASLLRDARSAAIAGNRPVAARFEASRRRLSAGTAFVWIPSDVDVELTTGGNCPAGEGVAALVFRPDGSSCGGILRLGRERRVLRARVDWASGHVDIVDGG